MKLEALLKNVATTSVEGSLDREVTTLAYDSRRVKQGAVFVAMKGEKVDGAQFVESLCVFCNGACLHDGFVGRRRRCGCGASNRIQIRRWRYRLHRTGGRFGRLSRSEAIDWTFAKECIYARLGIEIEQVACRGVARGDHLFTLA